MPVSGTGRCFAAAWLLIPISDPHSAPVGRVIFEIGGPVEIRPEVAKEGAPALNGWAFS